MSDYPDQVDIIRDRANRATPGPWGWFGNTSVQHVYLATQHWGRHLVMSFQRWGMQGAQPTFFERPTPEDVRKSIVADSTLRAAADVPVYEVAPRAKDKSDPRVYREDIIGLRNADASFIAHSREDVDYLLKEVDRLKSIIAEGVAIEAAGVSRVRAIGWFCEHRYGTPAAGTHMQWDHKKGKLVHARNTSSSMSYNNWPGDEGRRCPASVQMFVAATEAVEVAS